MNRHFELLKNHTQLTSTHHLVNFNFPSALAGHSAETVAGYSRTAAFTFEKCTLSLS